MSYQYQSDLYLEDNISKYPAVNCFASWDMSTSRRMTAWRSAGRFFMCS